MSRPSISRSSSLSSSSSATNVDINPAQTAKSSSKRTRKRFSQEQLMVLEQAYHKTSHPTRQEREAVAAQTGMDVKSVTIWLQNKRQTERKVALGNATNRNIFKSLALYHVQYPPSTLLATHDFDRRTPFPPIYPHTPSTVMPTKVHLPSQTSSSLFSLDRIASRAESPTGTPRTPTHLKRHADGTARPKSSGALWEAMPSSPLLPEADTAVDASTGSPSGSPSARGYLDFTSSRRGKSRPRGRRTLEWACAAARMSTDKGVLAPLNDFRQRHPATTFDTDSMVSDDRTEDVDTEVESVGDSHEAITPDNSQTMLTFSLSPVRISGDMAIPKSDAAKSRTVSLKDKCIEEDTDIMDAALALCGLLSGRRE
ncbi:hypothetical protein EW145_g551 [Phellinidium pouzarii]|uniref:Homeobox domain-containing protein n=1 Tax=Phellinidium pouzarii TaxID=167371 RepID=A0A4S4LIH5_9AGAM|nr:hypothetical protein EW145_g551 [Phellinidium pouzarii]